MPRLSRWLVVPFFAAAIAAAPRAEDAPVRDMVEISYDLMQKDLSAAEWAAFVKKTMVRYREWTSDYQDGDLKRFLDDRMLEMAPSVLSGNVKALKRAVHWLSLYKEFHELPPTYIREISEKCRRDIDEEMTNFSWERAAEKIKNRSKELEVVEKNEKKKQGKDDKDKQEKKDRKDKKEKKDE